MNSTECGAPRVKMLSAVIGGSAIVAMGALGVAFNTEQSTNVVSDPPTTITTGETSTNASIAPPAPETPLATPQITTTPTSAEPG